jgi:hypothetical protein
LKPKSSIIAVLFDFFGTCLLSLYALIIGPLGFLRGPLVLERSFWYVWVLFPKGLLAKAFRFAIDWRLGNFSAAINHGEFMINELEKDPHFSSQTHQRVLADMYAILIRSHLHIGNIDEAMCVVLKSNKILGVNKIVGNLDAKTAHLVRAGLAAGRLLDGDGLAAMFIKANPAVDSESNLGSKKKVDPFLDPKRKETKIIPFPKKMNNHDSLNS